MLQNTFLTGHKQAFESFKIKFPKIVILGREGQRRDSPNWSKLRSLIR